MVFYETRTDKKPWTIRLTTELLPIPFPILRFESMNNWNIFLPISSCSSFSLLSSCALVFSLFSLLCNTLAISTIAPLYITNPSCPFLTGVLRLLGELFTISSLFGSNKRLPTTKQIWSQMFVHTNTRFNKWEYLAVYGCHTLTWIKFLIFFLYF